MIAAVRAASVHVKHLCALVRKQPSTFHNVPPAWSGASAGFQKPFSACRSDDCDIFDQGVAVRERDDRLGESPGRTKGIACLFPQPT